MLETFLSPAWPLIVAISLTFIMKVLEILCQCHENQVATHDLNVEAHCLLLEAKETVARKRVQELEKRERRRVSQAA